MCATRDTGVIPGLVPGFHRATDVGARGWLDPGDKRRDNNVEFAAVKEREASLATTSVTVSETPLVLYALRRADDSLILGHRLSEWCGHAPMLEEDMALSNIALDLIGQAR